MAAPSHVVNLGAAGLEIELPDGLDEIVAVDVVTHLLALVTEDPVGTATDRAEHQIGKKAMHFGPGVGRAGKASATQADGWQSEVPAIFLHENIGGGFAGAEHGVR